MIELYSFDIFDTLISRVVYTPYGVFQIIREKINNDDRISIGEIREQFTSIRIKSEKQARKDALAAERCEVTLDDIYRAFQRMTGCNDDVARILMRMELDVEYAVSYGVKENIDLLKKHLLSGDKVALISDMYLSKSQIKRILRKIDPIFDNIAIYVSSEHNARKTDGSLYKIVREIENTTYDSWVHYGDNEVADWYSPEQLGIKVRYKPLCATHFLGDVKRLDYHDDRSLFYQLYYGGIRKLLCEGKTVSVGAECVAPILFSYVNWIIRVCEKTEIDRLFFMSRDGYLLKIIADLVLLNRSSGIRTKYIYGSRKALRQKDGEMYELAKQYLHQEISLDDNRFAIIDTQSSGRTMSYIAEMLDRSVDHPLNVFYYVLNTEVNDARCRSFSYTACMPMEGGIVEAFCRAPHGTTNSYSKQDDRVEPCFHMLDGDLFCYLEAYYDDIKILVSEMLRDYCGVSAANLTSSDISDDITEYAVSYTDEELNTFLGEIPHSNTENDEKFAPVYNKEDAYLAYLSMRYELLGRFYRGSNLSLSLIRSGPTIENLISSYMTSEYNKQLNLSKRIIIYGAGKIGKCVYEFSERETKCIIVGWADKRYKELCDARVTSIDDCLLNDFDYLVIAMVRDLIGVRDMFISRSVPPERIITYHEFVERALPNANMHD